MFQFPSSPNTLVTRQIECVCCREIFTITEDIAAPEPRRSALWRLLPDQYEDIRQRYDPRIGRKPIIPEARAGAQAEPPPEPRKSASHRPQIYCPRCGADNRNWLHIINPPPGEASFGQNRWWARFPTAGWGALGAFLIGCLGVLLVDQAGQSKGQSALLLVFVLIGVVLPTAVITSLWRVQRRANFETSLNREISILRRRISPTIQASTILFMMIAVFVPLFIYVMMPGAISWVRSQRQPGLATRIDRTLVALPQTVSNASQEDMVLLENSVMTIEMILSERAFDCQSGTLTTMIRNLEALRANSANDAYNVLFLSAINSLSHLRDSGPECRPELIQNAIVTIRALVDCTGPECPSEPPRIITFLPVCGVAETNQSTTSAITTSTTNRPQTNAPLDCYYLLLNNMLLQLNGLNKPAPNMPLYDRAKYALEQSRWLALTSSNKSELALIDKQVAIIEQVRSGRAVDGRSSNALESLMTWFFVVGIANLVAAFSAMGAVQVFVGRIDLNLPRPIGFSVADMTRVAIRDLRRSLDMGDEALHMVQWTGVNRERNGGIVIRGIFLPPEEAQNQDGLYVKTQCCEARTDIWARILEADVQFCRIPKLAVYPGRRGSGVGQDIDELDILFRRQQAERHQQPVTIRMR
jgi:hypothetical protein